MATYIYYHDDLDGNCAGYLAHTAIIESVSTTDEVVHRTDDSSNYKTLELVPTFYGDECIYKLHKPEDNVISLDLGFKSIQEIIDLCKSAKQVVIIDHHLSTENIINIFGDQLPDNLEFLVTTKMCTAMLSYMTYRLGIVGLNNIIRCYEICKYSRSEIESVLIPKWLFDIDNYEAADNLNDFVCGCKAYSYHLQENGWPGYTFWPELISNPISFSKEVEKVGQHIRYNTKKEEELQS